MQNDELLRCPFCGGTDIRTDHNLRNHHELVFCDDCSANISHEGTAADARDAWNRRASLSAAPAAEPTLAVASDFAKSPEGQELAAEVSEMAERVGVKFVPFAAPAADKGAPERPLRIWTCNETRNIWISEPQEDTTEYVLASSLKPSAAVPVAWQRNSMTAFGDWVGWSECSKAVYDGREKDAAYRNGRVKFRELFAAPPLPKEDEAQEARNTIIKAAVASIEIAISRLKSNEMYPAYGLNSQVRGLETAIEILGSMQSEGWK